MLSVLSVLVCLGLGFFVGKAVDRRHMAQLATREHAMDREVTAISLSETETWTISEPTMVTGSVVVSLDYWKKFFAAWRGIFGGEIGQYHSLMERARREAMLRMRERAQAEGRNAVVNVRLETAKVQSLFGGGGTAGVEVLAYGTAVRAREVARQLSHEAPQPMPWEAGQTPVERALLEVRERRGAEETPDGFLNRE